MIQDLHNSGFSMGNLWKCIELPFIKRFEQPYAAHDFTILKHVLVRFLRTFAFQIFFFATIKDGYQNTFLPHRPRRSSTSSASRLLYHWMDVERGARAKRRRLLTSRLGAVNK